MKLRLALVYQVLCESESEWPCCKQSRMYPCMGLIIDESESDGARRPHSVRYCDSISSTHPGRDSTVERLVPAQTGAMSSNEDKTHTFDFGQVDWDTYESRRPPYPSALYDIIFQHHQDHGGNFDLALDVGAGGGTVTRVLLQRFKHVVCSDAADTYVSQAAQRFSQEKSVGRVSFLARNFDEFDPESDFPDGRRVDMVTAGTCIHFGDPSTLTTQLAKLVKSGGTLAAFSYGSIPILPADEPAKHYVAATKDKIIRWIHENVRALDQIDATGTGQARYDNVDFDPALWTDVHRISSLRNEHVWPEWVKTSESRVRADAERKTTVEDDFITRTVDADFFPEYLQSLAPGFDVSDLIREGLEQIKKVLGDRKVLVKWPVMMVIATRK